MYPESLLMDACCLFMRFIFFAVKSALLVMPVILTDLVIQKEAVKTKQAL